MCPLGTEYNYFLACDTAERIIFAVVAGSGSGKLCWHSRGNDNDQENAGYVRENAGGGEQVLRAEEVQKRSFCRRSFPHFFRCWKKWGRRRQKKALAPGREIAPAPAAGGTRAFYAAARRHLIRPLRGHLPLKGKANGGASFNAADPSRGRLTEACHSTPRTPQGEGLAPAGGCSKKVHGFPAKLKGRIKESEYAIKQKER